MRSTRYSCHIFVKLEFSQHIFEKYSNNKFHETPSSGSRAVPCGRRDGRTDMPNSTSLTFYTQITPTTQPTTDCGTLYIVIYHWQLVLNLAYCAL
jgi:hypothetical protein